MSGVAVLIYFVIFPEDLSTLLSPLTTLFKLTNVVPPGLYALIAVAAILWFVERNWGRRREQARSD
jgi:hypothetical protein